jgi:hypothetical protein
MYLWSTGAPLENWLSVLDELDKHAASKADRLYRPEIQ